MYAHRAPELQFSNRLDCAFSPLIARPTLSTRVACHVLGCLELGPSYKQDACLGLGCPLVRNWV